MATDTMRQAPQTPERFRLNPEFISEALADEERTPERIVEMISDVEKRKVLAQELMEKVPRVSEQFPDIEALNKRLDLIAEVLPQKKTFFERVKEKLGWAINKVKKILTHPVVVTIIVALLAWWAWGHIHGLLANLHGVAGESALEGLEGLDVAPGVAHPGMGPGMEVPGGGLSPPGLIDGFEVLPPSVQPPSPPPTPPGPPVT